MNKLTITLLCIAFISINAMPQNADSNEKHSAKIKFTKTINDYGEIEINGDGSCEFKFTNEGEEALILTNVRSSCGCTVPKWPRTPIKKGEEATIKVRYNTARVGGFHKTVTVYSNGSDQPVILQIKGKVIAKKQ